MKANLSHRGSKNVPTHQLTSSTKLSKILADTGTKLNSSIKSLKSKKSINEHKNYDTEDLFNLEINNSISEKLDASKLNDFYVFKVKILSEDNTNLNEFDVNVHCKKMNTTLTLNSNGPIDLNQNGKKN